MWFLLLWVIGLVTSFVYFGFMGIPANTNEIASTLLLHQFVVTFGLLGVIGFIESIIFGNKIAKMIGWPGGPYQTKYGFYQLSIGVTGVMTIWFGGLFWLAALVNMYVFALSGLWTHTAEMINHKRLEKNHIVNIIINLAYQVFLTALYWLSHA